MKDDESFDEFYAKLKDIVNSVFNLRETIPEPKIMRKVLRSPPERFHAKITTIKESKDINKIPLTEMVGNLQTYELGLTRIGKSGESKSMALKAKSSDTDESSDDEDSKMKSYITRQFKKFMKSANGKDFDKDRRQSSSSQFKSQDKGKMMQRRRVEAESVTHNYYNSSTKPKFYKNTRLAGKIIEKTSLANFY